MSEQEYHSSPDNTGWQELIVGAGIGRPTTILVRPAPEGNAASPQTGTALEYLPRSPHLAHDASGRPAFSLTVVLSRRPGPDDENVNELIQSGVLAMDVTLALPQAIREELAEAEGVAYRPLFAREVRFELAATADEGRAEPSTLTAPALAETQTSGPAARAGLSATLDRSAVLGVLAALEGTPSTLQVRAAVRYRGRAVDRAVRLHGSWAEIHDFLSATGSPAFSLSELRHYFSGMLSVGVILAFAELPGGQSLPLRDVDPEPLFEIFMRLAAIILTRETVAAGQDGTATRFVLRGRPHEFFGLNYRQTLVTVGEQTINLHTPLDALLASALQEQDWEQFVHLVSPGDGGNLGPAPRRVRHRRRGDHWSGTFAAPARLGYVDGSVRALATMSAPSSAVLAGPALTAEARPAASAAIHHAALNDFVLEVLHRPQRRSLPVVDDSQAAFWRDRWDRNKLWYAPGFEVLQPTPASEPETSPFLFTYERTGATASGEPALSATVCVTLRTTMRRETADAIRTVQNARAIQVPLDNLSASLLIPFVDQRDGRVKVHTCPARVEQQGDTLIVTVHLQNDWVRLCYGALSTRGFQEIPVRLAVRYTFPAYVEVDDRPLTLDFGNKLLGTAVVFSPREAEAMRGQAFLDAASQTYHLPHGEIRFRRESPGRADRAAASPAAVAAPATAAGALALSRPLATVAAQPLIRPIYTQPQLVVSNLTARATYATRTQDRRLTIELLFPCNTLGALYRRLTDGTSTAIGCRDALQLGQTSYRQYEEIAELAHERYRVYRSLPQPGLFLVVPTAYRISRRMAGEPGAYRPTVVLYATLDPTDPANSQANLDLTLQPDLPLHLRRELADRLAAYAADPVVQYPTEILVETIEDSWLLDADVAVEVIPVGPFLMATMAMDIPGWQILSARMQTSGVTGRIRFALPDGSAVESLLRLELERVVGPWDTGPVATTVEGRWVRLSNRIEQAVDLHDLLVYPEGRPPSRHPVEQRLAPGATHDLYLDAPPAEAHPIYTLAGGAAGTIQEIRSFVEDIFQNVAFLNLIHFANHDLVRLSIEARIKGLEGTESRQLVASTPTAVMEFVLPLTTYLSSHVLEYRVTKEFDARPPETTPWLEVDLAEQAVISLTWEGVQ